MGKQEKLRTYRRDWENEPWARGKKNAGMYFVIY
jgi:hypothetical protein